MNSDSEVTAENWKRVLEDYKERIRDMGTLPRHVEQHYLRDALDQRDMSWRNLCRAGLNATPTQLLEYHEDCALVEHQTTILLTMEA